MLSNVGRHARASHLAVAMARVGALLCISVRDDGVGADLRAFEAPDAYGIMGMRERARHFGGRIEVRSAPGQGTTMILKAELTIPEAVALKPFLTLKNGR
jgi:signal transduction histidine kinase